MFVLVKVILWLNNSVFRLSIITTHSELLLFSPETRKIINKSAFNLYYHVHNKLKIDVIYPLCYIYRQCEC